MVSHAVYAWLVRNSFTFGLRVTLNQTGLWKRSMEPQHSALTGTHRITEFSTHCGQITDFFFDVLPHDHRIFFSSWRNVRPVDVLPHQITELSSQYRDINYFC
ncbi:hypothetical protein TNCV_2811211 [Trichonephila clavipes]|nr:hypothetical protein TNCV_2811211 [Trichonephila clavipes]